MALESGNPSCLATLSGRLLFPLFLFSLYLSIFPCKKLKSDTLMKSFTCIFFNLSLLSISYLNAVPLVCQNKIRRKQCVAFLFANLFLLWRLDILKYVSCLCFENQNKMVCFHFPIQNSSMHVLYCHFRFRLQL